MTNTSDTSSSASNNHVQEKTDPQQQQLSDDVLQYEVPCETKDGDIVHVRVALLHQSKTFKTMWKDLNMSSGDRDQLDAFPFPVKNISTKTFNKVVQWLVEMLPVPVVKEDPATRERIWFSLTDWEQKFFAVEIEDLAELLSAGNFLDIPSLYLYGCQSMAALIKDKSSEEIRDMFGLEDDLTEEQKAEIRRKNVWCSY